MINLADPWNCGSCVKKGLQERRNCSGLFRSERPQSELSPADAVFVGFHPLQAGSYRDLWLDRCPLNYQAASTGGISEGIISLLTLAGRYRNHGLLPYSGGSLEQPSKLLESIDAICKEQTSIERAKQRLEKARRETDKAFQEAKYGRSNY